MLSRNDQAREGPTNGTSLHGSGVLEYCHWCALGPIIDRQGSNELNYPKNMANLIGDRMRFLARSVLLFCSSATYHRKFAVSCLSASVVFRRSMHIERSDGTVTVSPQNEAQQSALVVIAHGLGDTAEGFADVAEVC
jgi:hypothetical protein